MTGWNLPPGCTTRHIDEAFGTEGPCACCGQFADNCICPECPTCGEPGRSDCYKWRAVDGKGHGLEFTDRQLLGQAKLKLDDLENAAADQAMYVAELEARIAKENDDVPY